MLAALCVVTLPGAPVAAQEGAGTQEAAAQEGAGTHEGAGTQEGGGAQEAAEAAAGTGAAVQSDAAAGPGAAPEFAAAARRDYWPLLAAGIGVTAGGLAGARLARLEYERWHAMPAGAANRDANREAFGTWTVAGSVAAAVGVGLIVLWATIRLSQDAREAR